MYIIIKMLIFIVSLKLFILICSVCGWQEILEKWKFNRILSTKSLTQLQPFMENLTILPTMIIEDTVHIN